MTITAGGGMGGSLWYEYVRPETIPANTIAEFCDINGHEVSINTRYVVMVRKVTVVECATMCANHNFYKEPTLERFRFQVPNGTEVKQVEEFTKEKIYTFINPNEK